MDNSPPDQMTRGNSALSWGMHPLVAAVALLVTVATGVWWTISGSSADRVVAATATILGLLATLCALALRRRLRADTAGFAVSGPLGTRRFSWSQVTAIAAPQRRRRGLRSVSVEIDLDDDGLIVLGRLELGADPAEVADALNALRLNRSAW